MAGAVIESGGAPGGAAGAAPSMGPASSHEARATSLSDILAVSAASTERLRLAGAGPE